MDLQKDNVLQMYLYPARLRVARRRRKILWFYTSETQFSFGNQSFSRIFYNDKKNRNLRLFFDKKNDKKNQIASRFVKMIKKINKNDKKERKSALLFEFFITFDFFYQKK